MRPVTTSLRLICAAVLAVAAAQPVQVSAADEGPAAEIVRGIGSIFGGRKQQPAKQAAPEQKSVEQAQTEDRQKGTVAGAAVGATAGAMINEDDRAKGAALGGVVGGVVGYGVGDVMAKKRGDYAARYNEIDQAIADAGQKNESLRAETSRIERRVTLRESQIKAAGARVASNQAAIAAHKQSLAEVEADIAASNTASESAMVSVKVLEDEIKTLASVERPDPQLQSRKTQLEDRRNELLATLQRINNVDTALVAQRDMLNGQRRG